MADCPTPQELVAAACHFGHPKHKWNPKMAPHIYGVRKGIHIFDLEKTHAKLQTLCDLVAKMQKEGKTLLVVSTKQQSIPYVEAFNDALSLPIVTKKWLPGLLTNWSTIKKRIKHYLDLKSSFSSGEISKYTKKEQTQLRKEMIKLETALGGVSTMTERPDAILVVDGVRDHVAVLEAKKIGIPVYGICDSNADPDDYTHFVPANDDAVKSIELILGALLQAMGGTAPKKPAAKEEESELVAA